MQLVSTCTERLLCFCYWEVLEAAQLWCRRVEHVLEQGELSTLAGPKTKTPCAAQHLIESPR